MAQFQRFECKYLIPRSTVEDLRPILLQMLEFDAHCKQAPGNQYTICSLYLDNPRMMLYRGTVEGRMNRYKLRLRIYDDQPDSPVFFETKSRVDGIVKKRRAAVKRSAYMDILQGSPPAGDFLFGRTSDKAAANLADFTERMHQIGASPLCLVRYQRQALVLSEDESLRVTFDWDLAGRESLNGELTLNGGGWRPADLEADFDAVILEIKFTNSIPSWLEEIVRSFGLRRTSVPKYIHCVDALELTDSPISSGGRLYR